MANALKNKKLIIIALSFVLLVTGVSLLYSQKVFAANDDAQTLNPLIDKSSPLYWVWWVISVGVLCALIIAKEILFFMFRWGIYGDVKLPKRVEKKVTTRANKKTVYTQDTEIRSVLAGNRTVEVDPKTCFVNNDKRK